MAFEKNTELAQQAVDHLVEGFRDSTKLQQLVTTYVDQLQDLEDAAFALIDGNQLGVNAVGAQLDNLGQIVGEERFGRNDADYIIAIRARIRLNVSNGTIEDIIALITALIPAMTVQVTEYFPARFLAILTTPLPPGIDPQTIANFVCSGKPAGVFCEIGVQLVANPFTYDIGPGYDIGQYATTYVGV